MHSDWNFILQDVSCDVHSGWEFVDSRIRCVVCSILCRGAFRMALHSRELDLSREVERRCDCTKQEGTSQVGW